MPFVDPTALAVAYLTPIVDPIPVASRVPDPRPDEFVQVRKTGGAAAPPVREIVRLDVHTWGVDDPAAYDLALTVRTAMWALGATDLLGVTVYQVGEFLAPRLLDDPESGTSRAWATYDLTIRADEIIHLGPTVNPTT